MRYLQVVATLLCALLVVIAWQLHGMRPVRQAEIDRLIEAGQADAAWEKVQRIPVVRVDTSGRSIEVHGTVSIEGTVSADVKDGWLDDEGCFHSAPVDVRIVE